MNGRPRKAVRLTVSLEELDYLAINEIARVRDASLSWVIRQAIRQFIDSSSDVAPRSLPPRPLAEGDQ